ncbi:MAG: DUF4836 family protein [Alistipes sp.]|nr:DUF4836 family protein [Alistipes sp.]
MKKRLILIIATVAIVAGIAIAIFATREPKAEERAKVEDILFLYCNPSQLASKGAFDKYITPEQRRMWATMLTANIEDDAIAENIKSTITDFNNLGVDLTKPLYAYVDEEYQTLFAVAEIADKNLIEKSLNNIAYIIEQQDNNCSCFEQNRDGGRLTIKDHLALSYNDERVVLAFREDGDVNTAVEVAYTRPLADLSIFGNSDMAMYINAYKLLNFGKQYVDQEIALYSDEDASHMLSELNNEKLLLEEWSNYVTPDAHLISDITFDAGRATLSHKVNGINVSEFEAMFGQSNDNHLGYISKDAIAVMNLNINGKSLSKQINTFLDSRFAEIMDIELSNQSRMILAVVCDAIESISGDVTLALQSINGKVVERINYFTGRIEKQPQMSSADFAVMMDVVDNYIITNVAQYTMGLLPKVGNNHYRTQLMGNTITLKQDDNLLFAGVNMLPEQNPHPATEAEWYNDVKNSRYYLVVNIDNLLSNRFLRSMNEIAANNIDINYRDAYLSLTEKMSYMYTVGHEPMQNTTVVVFDDKQTNSLEQLSEVIIPMVIKDINTAIF